MSAKIKSEVIAAFESGKEVPGRDIEAIQAAFASAGIAFIEDGASSPHGGPGLRLRTSRARDEGLRLDQLTTDNDD